MDDNSPVLKRIHERRPWSEIFAARASHFRESILYDEEELNKSRKATMDAMIARGFVATSLGKLVRAKLKTRGFSVRKSLTNFEKVEDNYEWDGAFQHRSMCDICNQLCINGSLVCQKCSSVAHRNCVNSIISNAKKEFHGINDAMPTYQAVPSLDEKAFVCSYCLDLKFDDLRYYDDTIQELKRQHRIHSARRLLQQFIMAYAIRVRFLRFQRGCIRFQANIRRKYLRRRFRKWLREQPAIVCIDLLQIPDFPDIDHQNSTVIICAQDSMKVNATIRVERLLSEAYEEIILLPGVTTSYNITISIVSGLDFYGQSVTSIRELEKWRMPRILTYPFKNKAQFPPALSETGHATHSWNYDPMEKFGISIGSNSNNNNNNNNNDDDDNNNRPTTSDSYLSYDGNRNNTRSPLVGGSPSSSPTYERPPSPHLRSQRSSEEHLSPSNSAFKLGSTSHLAPQHKSSRFGYGSALHSTHYKLNVYRFSYKPLSSLVAQCASILGPSIDILRKASDQFGHLMRNVRTVKRSTRYWVVTLNLRLLFYAYQGDNNVRINSDIRDATVTNVGPLVTVAHADKRVWQLEFDTPGAAANFVFAVSEQLQPLYTVRSQKYWEAKNQNRTLKIH